MTDIEDRYCHIPLDGNDSRATGDSQLMSAKLWMKVSVALIGGSCLVLMSILALNTGAFKYQRTPIIHSTSADESTSLTAYIEDPVPLAPNPLQRQVLGEQCSEEDLQKASMDLSGMIPGDLAAVKHSDGSWRYARLLQQNDMQLTFVVDGLRSLQEFPRDYWDQVKALKKHAGPGAAWEEGLLGPLVLTKHGLKRTAQAVAGRSVVLLYFGARWCARSGRDPDYMQKMVQAYNDLGPDQTSLQIVFISNDNDQESFDEYYSKQPWVALPFDKDEPQSSALDWYYQQLGWYYQQIMEVFQVRKMPTIVALDGRTGNVIDPNARKTLTRNAYDLTACLYDWGFANVGALVAEKRQSLPLDMMRNPFEGVAQSHGLRVSPVAQGVGKVSSEHGLGVFGAMRPQQGLGLSRPVLQHQKAHGYMMLPQQVHMTLKRSMRGGLR